MGLGAAGVKAQVRIGGNAAPNAAAVLDLNATDSINNGTKGLALPRVNLTSTTMQLTTGVTNLSGTLVYNTSTTLGAGVYFWNGTNWAALPAATVTPPSAVVPFIVILDTTISGNWAGPGGYTTIPAPRVQYGDVCSSHGPTGFIDVGAANGTMYGRTWNVAMPGTFRIVCLRPSV